MLRQLVLKKGKMWIETKFNSTNGNFKITPQIETIARVLKPLGMKLAIVPDNKRKV
jgi:hypothetical protein